jgi:hypothetical protein
MNSHQIEFEDYIAGEKFIDLAYPFNQLNSNISNIIPTNDNIIIYAHTHNASLLLSQINPKQKIILITHNSDGKVTKNPNIDDANISLMTEGIIKWFGTNIIDHNEKTISIPTGLENSCWFPEVNKQRQIYNINQTEKKVRNLCYMNFNITTNPQERAYLYEKFANKPWVTAVRGNNGYLFDKYLENIYHHPFVLCPEGNSNGHPISGEGTASHRFWECLYAGSIPIVTKGNQCEQFYDLPALFVDSWEQINEDFLLHNYIKYRIPKEFGVFNYEKLKFSYWKNKINEYIH